MGNCYSVDHTAEDHIHIDITCNTEELQQKYLETVSNRLLEGLNMFYWIKTLALASLSLYLNIIYKFQFVIYLN